MQNHRLFEEGAYHVLKSIEGTDCFSLLGLSEKPFVQQGPSLKTKPWTNMNRDIKIQFLEGVPRSKDISILRGQRLWESDITLLCCYKRRISVNELGSVKELNIYVELNVVWCYHLVCDLIFHILGWDQDLFRLPLGTVPSYFIN